MKILIAVLIVLLPLTSSAVDCSTEMCVERPTPTGETDPRRAEASQVEDQCCYGYEPGAPTAGTPQNTDDPGTTR